MSERSELDGAEGQVQDLKARVEQLRYGWKDDLMERGFADWEADEVVNAALSRLAEKNERKP